VIEIKKKRYRPRVFIGSSTEGLKIAKTIQLLLDQNCEVSIWSQGVFGLGEGSLEALVKSLDLFDFAILVLTPDDLVEMRGDIKQAPRDNVLLELGLFIGSLGRERSFAVYDRNVNLRLPSDLAGVTMATYALHESGNLRSSLGAAVTLIEDVIDRLGERDKPGSNQPKSLQTDEIKELRTQVSEMSQMLRQLVGRGKDTNISNKDNHMSQFSLDMFTGTWLNPESDTHYYPKMIGMSLVVPYCYRGNSDLTAVYYDWTRAGEFLFARFVWFHDDLSGFSFFRPVSAEKMEGWWWIDDSRFTEDIPDLYNLKEGVKAPLKRLSNKNVPKWASDFHHLVEKLGSVHSAIKVMQKASHR
jgi:Predicted nucleotide-binding protein containing TIR-like domain